MNGNPTHSDRFSPSGSIFGLSQIAAIVCLFSIMISEPVMAQMPSSSFAARTDQGESLKCQPSNAAPAAVICERSPMTSSAQPLDGATDMLLKLIYLGLPGVVLVGISLRTLHLHRQLMHQRAFVESLERIWERTVSY